MGIAYDAYKYAQSLFHGTLDKSGQPYIMHCARVGAAFEDPVFQAVGYLHDVIEDCDVTPFMLRLRFGDEVADAVEALSRRDGESYEDFIVRCLMNPIARRVKVADIRDNLRAGHYPGDKKHGQYIAALEFLAEKS